MEIKGRGRGRGGAVRASAPESAYRSFSSRSSVHLCEDAHSSSGVESSVEGEGEDEDEERSSEKKDEGK